MDATGVPMIMARPDNSPGAVCRAIGRKWCFRNTTAFMLRDGHHKYNRYIGYEPELFDLDADPEETTNLAGEAARDA